MSIHVISILGTSPAILTEFLWWLRHKPATLYGVEVWTTSKGADVLRAFLEHPAHEEALWAGLSGPPLPSRRCIAHDPQAAPAPGTLRVFQLTDAQGLPLDDIRGTQSAEGFAVALHDRVRLLRQQLPPETQLFGSIAGGRKTMSSALQSAFSLQARPCDALFHVLTAPEIEAHADFRERRFFQPSAALEQELGLQLKEQLAVHQVHFPHVAGLVRGTSLERALDQDDYQSIWAQLRKRAQGPARGTLRRITGNGRAHWELCIDQREQPLRLSAGCGETYLAILQRQPCKDKEWIAWLKAERSLFLQDNSFGEDEEVDSTNARGRVKKLREALSELELLYPEFIPTQGKERRIQAHVEWQRS